MEALGVSRSFYLVDIDQTRGKDRRGNDQGGLRDGRRLKGDDKYVSSFEGSTLHSDCIGLCGHDDAGRRRSTRRRRWPWRRRRWGWWTRRRLGRLQPRRGGAASVADIAVGPGTVASAARRRRRVAVYAGFSWLRRVARESRLWTLGSTAVGVGVGASASDTGALEIPFWYGGLPFWYGTLALTALTTIRTTPTRHDYGGYDYGVPIQQNAQTARSRADNRCLRAGPCRVLRRQLSRGFEEYRTSGVDKSAQRRHASVPRARLLRLGRLSEGGRR